MKKVKNLLLCSIFYCSIILGINNVCAENYSISVDAETGNAGSNLTMRLNGITDTSSDYFVLFVNKGTQKPDVSVYPTESTIGVDNKKINSFKSVSTSEGVLGNISIKDDWYMLNGYDYAYIVKCSSPTTCEVTNNHIKVDRPELQALGTRYQMFLFEKEKYLSVFPYFPHLGENGNHQIEVKIGLISDNSILSKLRNNTSDALSSLLTYAKNDSNGTKFKADDESLTSGNGININSFKVNNGSYYYIYTNYTDEMYRDLSDISIAMGEANNLVNDIEWDVDNNVKVSTTVKNPKTGIYYATGALSVLLIGGLVTFVLIRKRSKFPQVK